MDELVAWLRGVLDETELVARAAAHSGGTWDQGPVPQPPGAGLPALDGLIGSDEFVHYTADRLGWVQFDGPERAAHAARHDPRSVLARVEVERDVLDHCLEVIGTRDLSRYGDFGALKNDPEAPAVTLAVETVRSLACGHRHDMPGWRDLIPD